MQGCLPDCLNDAAGGNGGDNNGTRRGAEKLMQIHQRPRASLAPPVDGWGGR